MSARVAVPSVGRPPASRPSRDEWRRTAVVAGCAAVAVGAAALAMWYWRRQSHSASSAQPRRPPADYQQRVHSAIERMAATGEWSAADIAQHRAHLHWLAEHSAESDSGSGGGVSAADCLAVVKLMTTYHTLRNLHIAQAFDPSDDRSVAALSEWEVEQADDLERAWTILHSPALTAAASSSAPSDSSSPSFVAAYSSVPLLSLELAQRLKRGDRLSVAYEQLMATPRSERSEEQLIATFMTAPILGRWKDVIALGQQLMAVKGPNTMKEFHEAAMSDAAFVDYQLLFDKAAEWQRSSARRTPNSANDAQQLEWLKYDVDLIRVQHHQSYSPNPAVHAMLQSMAESQKEARSVTPPKGAFPLQVTGAIARMQSPGIVDLPCVGRYSNDQLSLHAAATLQQQQQQQQQEEADGSDSGELTMVELSIEAVKESATELGRASTWKGHYQIREYEVTASREKGPLKLMHQFHLLLNTSVA